MARCVHCGGELIEGCCNKCALPFSKQFCVGLREEALRELVSIYKYKSVRAAGVALAELVVAVLDADEYVVVPLPTIARHIRERGFDHMLKLAQAMAPCRDGLRVEQALIRANKAVQVGASEERRKEQAKSAYKAREGLDIGANYLLVDDVWTTGSSMRAACEVLRARGCQKINIAVVARNG